MSLDFIDILINLYDITKIVRIGLHDRKIVHEPGMLYETTVFTRLNHSQTTNSARISVKY